MQMTKAEAAYERFHNGIQRRVVRVTTKAILGTQWEKGEGIATGGIRYEDVREILLYCLRNSTKIDPYGDDHDLTKELERIYDWFKHEFGQ